MTVIQKYAFENYANWNAEIFAAIKTFIADHKVAPNIILTNTWTSQRLDGLVAVELFEKGVYDYLQVMGTFSCSLATLNCCVEEELLKHQFELVFDDQAEFLDPENEAEENSMIEGGYSYAA